MPVPVRTIVCGEPEASSAIIKSAMRWPGAVGLKVIEMAQLALGRSGAVQFAWKSVQRRLGPKGTKG